MKIHEYQGKELLRGLGVPVPLSRVAFSPADVRAAANELHKETGNPVVVVKAQIHAGGRGKGRFKEHPDLGGVKVAVKSDLKLVVNAASDSRSLWLAAVNGGTPTQALGDIVIDVWLQ